MTKKINIRLSDDDMELLRTAMGEKRWDCIQKRNDFAANRYQNLLERIAEAYRRSSVEQPRAQISFIDV